MPLARRDEFHTSTELPNRAIFLGWPSDQGKLQPSFFRWWRRNFLTPGKMSGDRLESHGPMEGAAAVAHALETLQRPCVVCSHHPHWPHHSVRSVMRKGKYVSWAVAHFHSQACGWRIRRRDNLTRATSGVRGGLYSVIVVVVHIVVLHQWCLRALNYRKKCKIARFKERIDAGLRKSPRRPQVA